MQYSTKTIVAALWFAGASAIPTFLVFPALNTGHVVDSLLFLATPIVAALWSGARVGQRILDAQQVTHAMQAMHVGANVALNAYGLFALTVVAQTGFRTVASGSSFRAVLSDIASGLVGMFILVPLFTVWVVPLIVLVGGSAGGLLYLCHHLAVQPRPQE